MNLIVVVDKNYGIGKDNQLLTYLPEDLKRFKKITMDKVVVLGRKTLETFPGGKPLKGRTNIILSRDKNLKIKGAKVVHSVNDVMDEIKKYVEDDVFIIGGASVYDKFLPFCKYAYVTKIDKSFEADTFFKNLDEQSSWELIEKGEKQEYKGTEYYYTKYANKYMI